MARGRILIRPYKVRCKYPQAGKERSFPAFFSVVGVGPWTTRQKI